MASATNSWLRRTNSDKDESGTAVHRKAGSRVYCDLVIAQPHRRNMLRYLNKWVAIPYGLCDRCITSDNSDPIARLYDVRKQSRGEVTARNSSKPDSSQSGQNG